MKFQVKVAAFVLSALFANAAPCVAHEGHSHTPATQEATAPGKLDDAALISTAVKSIKDMVDQKTKVEGKELDTSWKSICEQEGSITKKGEGYTIVGVKSNQDATMIYLLISDLGEIYDANFTGTFKDLKDK